MPHELNSEEPLVWGILQAAEQGRCEEMIAQSIASMIIAGDGEIHGLAAMLSSIMDRAAHLMVRSDQIWDDLLPGPPREPIEYVKRNQAYMDLHQILDGKEWNADTMELVKDLLVAKGFTLAEPPSPDQWTYHVDFFNGFLKMHSIQLHLESPLGAARDVKGWMAGHARNPKTFRAVISNKENSWLMDYGVADLIIKFEIAQHAWDKACPPSAQLDWSDLYGEIAESMAFAAAEFLPTVI